MHRKAVVIQKVVFGGEHLEVARSLDLLGLALHPWGKADEAETAYRKALGIQGVVMNA